MVTIAAIETQLFRLPMHGSLLWGKSSMLSELRHVLVRVRLSDGSEGVSEAPPRPTIYGESGRTICYIIAEELAPRVLDMDAADPAAVWDRLCEVKNNHTAKAAIDMALHVALAQSNGCSLEQQLQLPNGTEAQQIRVSYILGIGDQDAMVDEALRVARQGVQVFKVKVGREWEADLARIQLLQETLGPQIQFYADANECFTPQNAASRLDELAARKLLYCEEPLPIEQVHERATLRAGEHLPLIADDSAFNERDLHRELQANTFDILNIKPARTGYTASQLMLQRTVDAGKRAMVGSQASAALGTARAALVAAMGGVSHPSELSFFLKLKEDIVAESIPISNGTIKLADALGVVVDRDLLRSASIGDDRFIC